jgi:putative transcriptional regulator
MKGRSKRLPVAAQIRKGLEESIRRAEGEITLKTTILDLPGPPPEIGADELARLRLGSRMSQAVFARLLNVSTKTVRSWEQGTRKPSQAALRLIQVFRQDPSGVLRVAGMTGSQAETPQARQESRGVARKGRTSSSKAKKQTV